MPLGHMLLTKVLMQNGKPALLDVFHTFMKKGKIVDRKYDSKQLIYDYTINHPDFLPDDEQAQYVLSTVKCYDGWNMQYNVSKLSKVLSNGDRLTVKDFGYGEDHVHPLQ